VSALAASAARACAGPSGGDHVRSIRAGNLHATFRLAPGDGDDATQLVHVPESGGSPDSIALRTAR
jgi:hypothetical protein